MGSQNTGITGGVRRRIVVLFLLGVAVPSALLGYLALRGVRNDQALFEREQREFLEQTAQQLLASFEARLFTLEGAPDFTDREVKNELIDANFSLSDDGRFVGLTSSFSLYNTDPVRQVSQDEGLSDEDAVRLSGARQLELRDGEFENAFTEYQVLSTQAVSLRGRAEGLAGMARVAGKQGRSDLSASYYRQLISGFGPVASGAGVPFGLVGHLEILSLLRTSSETERAATETVELLDALLTVRYPLDETEYGFVATRARAESAHWLAALEDTAAPETLSRSLRMLLARESIEQARSSRIQGLFTTVVENPDLFQPLAERVRALGPQGAIFQGEGGPFAVYFKPVESARGSGTTLQGLLLNPDALEEMARSVVSDAAATGTFRWTLTSESGQRIWASDGLGADLPLLSLSFPYRFPPLILGLLPPETGIVQSFFTSPRSVYLYAFLLVVGILAGGLALTVRTLNHQLELSRMQADFVSTVSHELKSPLTSIRQVAEMLHTGRVPSEQRRQRYFDLLLEQSERLTALIDHVLNFARMDAGQSPLDLVETDVADLIDHALTGIGDRLQHEGFTVHGDIEADLPKVQLDRAAVTLAVINLLDNAIKYSGDSREIIVRAGVEASSVVIAVQDFGIGLDAADQEHVFERFYRGGDAHTRAVKGTGLGLTLVRHVAEAHGGSITVASEPGKGSTFTLQLPVFRS